MFTYIRNIVRKEYIVQADLLNQYKILCLVCRDIAINPVLCTSCRSLYCFSCATQDTKTNQCPIKCKLFKDSEIFEIYQFPEIQMYCPFLDNCPRLNCSTFIRHLYQCQNALEQIKKELHLKKGSLCSEHHSLILQFNDIWQKCAQCNNQFLCKFVCKYDQKYFCIKCRPVLIRQGKCINGSHTLVKSSEIKLFEHCHICGGRPGYLIKPNNIHFQDKICNINICLMCSNEEIDLNHPNIESIKIKKQKSKIYKCDKDHKITFWNSPEMFQCKCSICSNVLLCRYRCMQCKQFYCIKCKPVKLKFPICPLKIHQLKYVKYQKSMICNFCLTDKDLKFYNDQFCDFSICEKCTMNLTKYKQKPKIEKIKEKSKKILLQPNKCIKGHNLKFWIQNFSTMTNAYCESCKKKTLCRHYCKICKTTFCLKCSPITILKPYCPSGKHKMQVGIGVQKFICDGCQLAMTNSKNKVYKDQICNYILCQKCYENMKDSEADK